MGDTNIGGTQQNLDCGQCRLDCGRCRLQTLQMMMFSHALDYFFCNITRLEEVCWKYGRRGVCVHMHQMHPLDLPLLAGHHWFLDSTSIVNIFGKSWLALFREGLQGLGAYDHGFGLTSQVHSTVSEIVQRCAEIYYLTTPTLVNPTPTNTTL